MGHSSGYHTDVEYHLYEEANYDHCPGPGYRNPRSVVIAKNENAGKCKNVDAYFVDTLNKSMDEGENSQPCSKSVEHLYAEVKPKKFREEINQRSPNIIRRNSLGSCSRKSVSNVTLPFRTNQGEDDSSSDSCGSSFIPAGAKLSEKQRSPPPRCRPARSSSTCSMPAEVANLRSLVINNSESMPNITNSSGVRLLAASQLNSSSSLSESDNMSERSGYVSSHKSSIGSTAPMSPNGESKEAQKFVRGDVLKEKLERLVRESKNRKKMNALISPPKDYVNFFELRASTLPVRHSKSKQENEYEIPFSLKDLEPMAARIYVSPVKRNGKMNELCRSESTPARYMTAQHDQEVPNIEEQCSDDENVDREEKQVESENDSWSVPGEISRYDPKRISRRFIQRKPNVMMQAENGHDGHDLLPPTQFQDAPPPLPPEAFRDPPQPIDNILYYVVESVHENREMNRRDMEEERMHAYSRK